MTALLELQRKLVNKSLAHIPFDGWGEKSLLAAAQDIGVTAAEARNAFPGGGVEMVILFNEMADEAMVDAFTARQRPERISDSIALLMRLRFEAVAPYKEAQRSAIGLLALPGNMSTGLRLLNATVDLIWRQVGDYSADFSFYTKRATLAALLSAATFYWLADRSVGHEQTWLFIERQMFALQRIPRWRKKWREARLRLPDPMLLYRRARWGGQRTQN
ncbi:MAG TPA: COQ9 family protein [Dongiaceae bacterium]|jgi:ubiquinone biosynthesis protein COQ9|nr:COQ9 family protein [Dongiaceae bacterium]